MTLNERLIALADGEREVAAGMDMAPEHTANGQYAQTADDARVRIAVLEDALREIAANTYGTELCNTDEDNLDIVFRHLRRHQEIARAALEDRPAAGPAMELLREPDRDAA